MKKKLIIVMLAALVAVPVIVAAADQGQLQNSWFNQMFNNHQQMIKQAVDNGAITAEQGARMDEHMQQMAPVMQNGGMMNGGMMQNWAGSKNSGMMGNYNKMVISNKN